MPDFAIPQNELGDIAYECGVFASLYYASTEVYHIGTEDVGLAPDQQAARAAMANVASQLIDNALLKRAKRLYVMLQTYSGDQPVIGLG